VTELDWRETPEGYECDHYRIRRLDGRPRPRWSLETRGRTTARRSSRALTTSSHTTLQQAKERAQRQERVRIRRARTAGHLIVGIVASLGLLAISPYVRNLAGFLAAIFLLYVALRSIADAVGVWLGDAWGWTRDRGEPERLTWSGRLVLTMMEGLRRRSMAPSAAEPSPTIVMLPPEAPR